MNLYEEYAQLLFKWNKVHNLTGAKTLEEIYKNIEDSLYPKALLQDAQKIVDIGSGAGFPGLLLAIAYPHKQFVLTEPIKKKASFLKSAVRNLKLTNVTVCATRVEELDTVFDFVVSRAVAPTKTLLALSKAVTDKDTRYLFYKGEEVHKELQEVQIKYELIENEKRIYLYIKETDA